MPAFQPIPDDIDKYVYLYHPDFATAKRVQKWDTSTGTREKHPELQRWQQHGWSTSRFACMLYHGDDEPIVTRTHDEMEAYLAEGWTKEPPAEGRFAHPHANDVNRKRFLARRAAGESVTAPAPRRGRPPLNRAPEGA